MAEASQRTLADWLFYIEQTHPENVALGLDRVQQVAQRMGLLPPAALSVLIAGTNGKGSTATALEQLLIQGSALKVGTTLSPHLERFNERVRVQGEPVADPALCDAFSAIETARGATPLTYFEFSSLAALYCFAQAQCDVIVLEVGLGGRLDAFNVVDATIGIVTSIGLDHQAWLGDTLEAIGAEKAGILRGGQKVFLGPAMPASVIERLETLETMPVQVGVELSVERDPAGQRVQFSDKTANEHSGWLADVGFVPANLALAWAAARAVLAEQGLAAPTPLVLTRWAQALGMPGRCEQRRAHGRRWLLDVGHNPLAATYLRERLQSLLPVRTDDAAGAAGAGTCIAVFGCLADKPGAQLAEALAPLVAHWVLVPSAGPRGQSAQQLAQALTLAEGSVHQANSVEQGLRAACVLAGEDQWILVFGGFSVVGAARRWLPAADA